MDSYTIRLGKEKISFEGENLTLDTESFTAPDIFISP